MGVNLTAIYLNKEFDGNFEFLLNRIEKGNYKPIDKFNKEINTSKVEPFAKSQIQWYLNDERIDYRPELPDINSSLQLPEGIVMRFREDGFEVWLVHRAIIAIQDFNVAVLNLFKQIKKDFYADECWVMGDDNPICHSFRNNNSNFKEIENDGQLKYELEELYSKINEGRYKGCYEIIGYIKL